MRKGLPPPVLFNLQRVGGSLLGSFGLHTHPNTPPFVSIFKLAPRYAHFARPSHHRRCHLSPPMPCHRPANQHPEHWLNLHPPPPQSNVFPFLWRSSLTIYSITLYLEKHVTVSNTASCPRDLEFAHTFALHVSPWPASSHSHSHIRCTAHHWHRRSACLLRTPRCSLRPLSPASSVPCPFLSAA